MENTIAFKFTRAFFEMKTIFVKDLITQQFWSNMNLKTKKIINKKRGSRMYVTDQLISRFRKRLTTWKFSVHNFKKFIIIIRICTPNNRV